jgi:general stress protein YciG
MTDTKYKRTKRGLKAMKEGGKKGGKIGGAISPANFKNNPEAARAAAMKSVEARRAKKLAAQAEGV